MKNGYKISLLIVAILLAFSMTVGTSYAYWTKTVTQTNTNEVGIGCLKIELNDVVVDKDGNTASTGINLSNAYPISDTKGLSTKPYNLTIKNVCSIDAKYTIYLNTLSSSLLNESKIKYHFIETSPIETSMTPQLITSLNKFENLNDLIGESNEIFSSYELSSGILKSKTENVTDSVNYNLRLWIDESVGNEIMGNTYEAAIMVYAETA